MEMFKTIDNIANNKENQSLWNDVKSSLKTKVDNLEKHVSKKKESLQLSVESPHFVRTKDKLTFVLGVVNVCLTPYLLGGHPHLVAPYYAIKALLLIGFRFFSYKQLNWHYFLFDFCYFANLWLLFYLYLLPQNSLLFAICFGMANGPLIWAIPTWRNSMVFHSIDKITSVFIHVGPPIVTHAIRWHHKTHYPNHSVCPDEDCDIPWYYLTILPLIPYVIWQILYFIKVEIFSSHKNRVTSAKWLLEGDSKGFIYNMSIKPFGEKYKLFGLILNQFIFTFLTLIPIKLFWDNQFYHLGFIIFMTLISVWNGATFYFDVFSKKYIESLQQQEKKLNELMKKLNSEE